MQEIWKDVPNYEGLYQVSNLGRVKSTPICKYKKPKILKNIPRNGYVSVILCVNKKQKTYLCIGLLPNVLFQIQKINQS